MHAECYIINDGAYPLSNYLIKPFNKPQIKCWNDPSGHRSLFNKYVSSVRANIEHAFGLMKAPVAMDGGYTGRDSGVIWTCNLLFMSYGLFAQCSSWYGWWQGAKWGWIMWVKSPQGCGVYQFFAQSRWRHFAQTMEAWLIVHILIKWNLVNTSTNILWSSPWMARGSMTAVKM
jgi:hypothetical protein